MRTLSLRANFSWAFIGNSFYAACKWGIIAFIAKFTTTEDLGLFGLGVAISTPVFMLLDLQLRAIQATDARGDYSFGDYANLRMLTSLLGLSIVILLALITQARVEGVYVICMIGAWRASESLSDVIYGGLQRVERLDHVSHSLLIKGVVSLALMAATLLVTKSVVWATAALASGAFGSLLLVDLHLMRKLDEPLGKMRPRVMGRLVWHALPLGIVMMLISLNTNVPRYFVEATRGAGALGVFTALVYMIVAGGTVVAAIGQAAAPRLSQYAASNDRKGFNGLMARLFGVTSVVGISGIVVAWLFGEDVLRLLYTSEYAEYDHLLVGVMCVGALLNLDAALGYAMTAVGAFRPQLPLFIVTVMVTLSVGWWAIHEWGLEGAVATMASSALVQGIGALIVLKWAWKRKEGISVS